ncbi:hypothetical protein NH340_JMT07238 [Sarcoptes scabiei]|uniref:NADH dehydrogenase [ubiquinone] 1 alpha subcomplex subunit 2 n=1 Tax=Sarcoptes scabiei TaxID=52283 RepID=A0A132A7E4_SARSC|nr:Mitochondrial ribosomal protein L51-like protein [Sarcoptes scabiei]UXI21295.1 hypothetical protein NH340_JMT07238 [Sarcoptes scabiei]
MATKILKQNAKKLRELRIHLCPNSNESQGVRNFINSHYVALKKQIPDTPILIREARGIQPKVWARFDYCKEECLDLSNQNSDAILKQIKQFLQ